MNLVSLEKRSIVLLNACCASDVNASASSRNIIFMGTLAIDIVFANSLTSPLITSIPRASDALSSLNAPVKLPPYKSFAIAMAHVVLPTPAVPANIMLGKFPFLTNDFNLSTTRLCPITSSRLLGLYFSVQGRSSVCISITNNED